MVDPESLRGEHHPLAGVEVRERIHTISLGEGPLLQMRDILLMAGGKTLAGQAKERMVGVEKVAGSLKEERATEEMMVEDNLRGESHSTEEVAERREGRVMVRAEEVKGSTTEGESETREDIQM